MIEVKNIYKSFNDFQVLKDINVVFEKGKPILLSDKADRVKRFF